MSIHGFRSIDTLLNLPIRNPTLLTGHNDAGKSATLDAVRFLLNKYPPNERDMTYLDPGDDPKTEESLALKTDSIDGGNKRVAETCVEGRFELSKQEQSDLSLAPTICMRRRFQAGGNALFEIMQERPVDERLRNFHGLNAEDVKKLAAELSVTADKQTRTALLPALERAASEGAKEWAWETAPPAVIKALPAVLRFEPVGQNDAEYAIKTALQAAYDAHASDAELKGKISTLELDLQEKLTKDASNIRQHIMDRCSDIGDVSIIPDVSFTTGLKATQVSVTARAGEGIGLGEAGAGRARRVALAVWEYTKGLIGGPGAGDVVLLYDEPDTHLDYAHQRELMKLLREQCELPNVRMIVATHSMNLIDGVDISDVVHVKHQGHRTVVDMLADDSDVGRHLGAVAASLGLRNTVLLHERIFVGVEGVSELSAFPVLFKLATGSHLESCGIALWACRNNEGATDFAKFLVEHARQVAFIIDSDSKTANRNVFSDKKLMEKGLDPNKHAYYIGNPAEFEDTFTDEQWAEVANAKWPHKDGVPWEPINVQELRSSKKFSDALLLMFKEGSLQGPTRKQQLTTEMALSLSSASDVPRELRDHFQALLELAN
nr:TOPRIM nucleotidyl transferase/hydrolase domain-containing protein [Arthrobacter oryzae]